MTSQLNIKANSLVRNAQDKTRNSLGQKTYRSTKPTDVALGNDKNASLDQKTYRCNERSKP